MIDHRDEIQFDQKIQKKSKDASKENNTLVLLCIVNMQMIRRPKTTHRVNVAIDRT